MSVPWYTVPLIDKQEKEIKMNSTTISKADLEAQFGYTMSDEEYATAYYCEVACEEWTTLSDDGYPNCQCN